MSTRYRIFCDTENKWVETWADVAPTECPNDSNHTVVSNSVQEMPIRYGTGIRLEFRSTRYRRNHMRTNSWKKLTTYGFPGTDRIGFLRTISVVSNMKKYNNISTDIDNDVGNQKFGYYIRIYDQTNKQTVYESGFLGGTPTESLKLLGNISNSNLSSDPAVWIIGIKRADNTGDTYLDGIDLYFYKV